MNMNDLALTIEAKEADNEALIAKLAMSVFGFFDRCLQVKDEVNGRPIMVRVSDLTEAEAADADYEETEYVVTIPRSVVEGHLLLRASDSQ